MITYINDLLPRLQQYSQTLDRKTLFINKPWIIIDEAGNKQQYIFQENNQLIKSFNGDVEICKWQYIPASQSLMLTIGSDVILLNQAFVSNGIMLLEKDGGSDITILCNQQLVPDLDWMRYLRKFIIEKENLKQFTVDNTTYYCSSKNSTLVGSAIYDKDLNRIMSDMSLLMGTLRVSIINGVIRSVKVELSYSTDRGKILVDQANDLTFEIGDKVLLNNNNAEGHFKIIEKSDKIEIDVRDGSIVRITHPIQAPTKIPIIILSIVIFFVACIILYVNSASNSPHITFASDSNTNSVDSAAITGTSTNIPIPDPKLEEAKNRVTAYMEAINKRDFTNLQASFSPTIKYYYGTRYTTPLAVVQEIAKFWSAQPSESNLSSDSMESQKDADGYLVDVKQIETIRDINNLPYILQSNQKYHLSHDLQIDVMTGRITSKVPDLMKIFPFQKQFLTVKELADQIGLDEINIIFRSVPQSNRMSDTIDSNTIIIQNYFRSAVFAVLNPNLQVSFSDNSQNILLSEYIEKLLKGDLTFRSVSQVLKDKQNKVNGIIVE